MVTYTKDYYAELSADIKPTLGRVENSENLKKASAKYSQMAGTDVKLRLVEEALDIFGTEARYQVYRHDYVTLKLETFIEGAQENAAIPKDKYEKLKKVAWGKYGISENEVDTLLKSFNIIVGKPTTPPPGTGNGGGKNWKVIILSAFLVVVVLFFAFYYFGKTGKPQDNGQQGIIETTISLTEAIGYIDIKPPEYTKIEEAIKSFRVNIDQPGAREGLLKATDIYLKWGDDAPTTGETREMYQKALECSSAANGPKTGEIKAKLEELTQ